MPTFDAHLEQAGRSVAHQEVADTFLCLGVLESCNSAFIFRPDR
jgi:hypothetical protein